jgi:glycosyltransferase involved in cell wall biosynthesis
MKILHLTTSLEGGAGLSALKLHRQLRVNGVDSNLISRSNLTNEEGLLENRTSRPKLIFSKANTVINRLISYREYGFVSPKSVSTVDLRQIYYLNPDIIHIHNWYNLTSIRNLQKLVSEFPVVITAHDFRIGSGACHVSLDCENFKNACKNCPALKILKYSSVKSKSEMQAVFEKSINLRVVAPSKWLAHKLESSLNIDTSRISTISNIPDVQISSFRKTSYSAKLDKLLFVSAEINSPFKGLALLISALNKLQDSNKLGKDFTLTVAGNGDNRLTKTARFRITQIGKLGSVETLELMTKQDLLVVPSFSDNRPSVILEAQEIGLPVLATRAGGIPELIIDGQTGFLVDPEESALAKTLDNLDATKLQNTARRAQQAESNEDSRNGALQKHIELYSEMMRDS